MATKQIAWTTGSGYITLTYNGLGNGTITVSSDDNTGVAREQIITIETTAGTPVVTKNITIRQEAYVPPILNFSYTGTVQSCTLPPGTYKLQCWGAQGGQNPAYPTYGIISVDGGKGGYSEGILTLTSPTTLYIFVGGQPSTSSTNGGWNGGGGGSGTSTAGTPTTATYGLGYTCVGRGGGATDLALVTSTMSYSSYRTNRSSASLLSRFIVAGGGSGGAMAYNEITTSSTSWVKVGEDLSYNSTSGTWNNHSWSRTRTTTSGTQSYVAIIQFAQGDCPLTRGHYKAVWSGITQASVKTRVYWSGTPVTDLAESTTATGVTEVTREFDFEYDAAPSASHRLRFQIQGEGSYPTCNLEIYKQISNTVVTDTYDSQVGYAGGGTEGKSGGSSGSFSGKQDSAGTGGGFGYGKNQVSTSYRYPGACGGAGWYGGGNSYGNGAFTGNGFRFSGGGSGFVNIAENAQYRPTGYTGIELDSGATYDGETSFPSTSGTIETGHSGDGYARITCMGNWEAKLPAGYTLLDYIENVNSAYINTGVNAANDIGIHIEYEDNYTYGSSSNYVVGARATSSSTILIGISGSSSGNTSNISYNGSSVNLGVTRSKGKKYVVDLQADSTGLDYRYVIDGSEVKTGRLTKTLSATSTPICLFGFNSSNIKKNTRMGRCYITDGGDVVRYFLPCKNASNVVGLYDCVNGVFYGSSNSNTFTAGSNIN